MTAMMMMMMIAAVVLVVEYRKKGRLAVVTDIHLRDTVYLTVQFRREDNGGTGWGCFRYFLCNFAYFVVFVVDKAIPLQTWTGP